MGGGLGKVRTWERMEQWRGDGVVGREPKGIERTVRGKKRNVIMGGLVWIGS